MVGHFSGWGVSVIIAGARVMDRTPQSGVQQQRGGSNDSTHKFHKVPLTNGLAFIIGRESAAVQDIFVNAAVPEVTKQRVYWATTIATGMVNNSIRSCDSS